MRRWRPVCIVVATEDFGPPDGRGASSEWMHSWTIFYWGWWISWGPFVGTFLARISKGRTLGEFIVGVLSSRLQWRPVLPAMLSCRS